MSAIGTAAADFALPDQHGRTVGLADFRGRKNVVLVFYPFSFTGVCAGELQALQAQSAAFEREDAQILAVSCDSMHTQRVFSDQEALDLPLLSDFWPHGAAARAYGVFAEDKGCALRGTFVIDRGGIVRWSVVNELPDARDLHEYVKALEAVRSGGTGH
ncbi:peroxiredoxin [Actinacidiphila paucisporea]|uniref:Alkyl hydroperoxide reductase E n=1 Tax=Actinacidiphila paucisporea TaxID=310782 RepID=A0A1M6XJT9_9ACTN|nr:peroxiredoxin [Actinacidiphila paucisporea]SHL06262.1 Peroxiredoxin [Actinacidiphila paucisporea]